MSGTIPLPLFVALFPLILEVIAVVFGVGWLLYYFGKLWEERHPKRRVLLNTQVPMICWDDAGAWLPSGVKQSWRRNL